MSDFFVGQSASMSKQFSQEEVDAFSKMSLDINPIHLDEAYAAKTLFGRRIIHGFLSGSLISAVIGNILPGEGAIYLHQDMDFRKPAYTDDVLTATVTVERINPEKHILYLNTVCTNEKKEVVIEGSAVVKYYPKDK
ncbi:MAG: MaoC family dehydratase [Bacteroidales bacterium]|nr:MaoC family dehydratase [Bacteroidales bacterium]